MSDRRAIVGKINCAEGGSTSPVMSFISIGRA
jgi:hypothetical protein